MTIDEIARWFANGYRRMHMKVQRGDHSFYPCEDGPTCDWPRLVSLGTYKGAEIVGHEFMPCA